MNLVTTGDKKSKVLNKKAQEVGEIDADINTLIVDMFECMEANQGIGLAAPQIGKNLQIFVVGANAFKRDMDYHFKKIQEPDLSDGYAFINPKLKLISESKNESTEGCLSIPDKQFKLNRAKKVQIKATNKDGEKFKLTAKNLLAIVLQHEYDHLQGTLIQDKGEVIEEDRQ